MLLHCRCGGRTSMSNPSLNKALNLLRLTRLGMTPGIIRITSPVSPLHCTKPCSFEKSWPGSVLISSKRARKCGGRTVFKNSPPQCRDIDHSLETWSLPWRSKMRSGIPAALRPCASSRPVDPVERQSVSKKCGDASARKIRRLGSVKASSLPAPMMATSMSVWSAIIKASASVARLISKKELAGLRRG